MNQELIGYGIGVLVVVVAAGILWFRKYKSKIEPILNDSEEIIGIINKLIEFIFNNDDQLMDKTRFYLAIADQAVKEVLAIFKDDVDVRKKSVEVIYRILNILGESPTAKQHQAIHEFIDEALKQLNNQK